MVGSAHRLRIMGSLALSLCHLAAGPGRRRLLAQAGPLGRHRRRPAARTRVRPRDRPLRGSAVRCSPARPRRTFARRRSGNDRAVPEAGRRPHRIGCSGWNYASWRHGVFYPERCPPRRWLGVLRTPLRHRRAERDVLPPADGEGCPGLGRPDAGRLRLRGQDEPLRHAREAAARPPAQPGALLLADRAARALTEARAGALAAAADVPARRRPARRGARAAPGGTPRVRVPPSRVGSSRRWQSCCGGTGPRS